MVNLFDLIPIPEPGSGQEQERVCVPSSDEALKLTDRVLCSSGHFRVCPDVTIKGFCECGERWKYKVEDGILKELKRIDRTLGPVCKCCGSIRDMQVDHIRPRVEGSVNIYSREAERISCNEEIEGYQRLCRPCNMWKSVGPCCPCHYWDTVDSEWRSRVRGKFGNLINR